VSFHLGFGTERFHRIVTGWTGSARHLHEYPADVSPAATNTATGKAYESGVLLRLDPRIVDVPISPVRLPADFWRRAIWSEHVA
jgi:hypothetical protein